MRSVWFVVMAMLLVFPAVAQAGLTVISTDPRNGARGVDPNRRQIRVRFSAPVQTNHYAFCTTEETTEEGRYPEVAGDVAFQEDGRVCVLPVKLQPGTTYSLSINSEEFAGFRSAADDKVTVVPYVLTFTTSGEGPATKSPTQRWQEDLVCLATTLPAKHKNLFFQLSKEQFGERVADLDKRIPDLTEDRVAVEMLKLVAAVGDGHTHVGMWGPLVSRAVALRFYWFRDGIFVVAAGEQYKRLLGSRVERVGNMSVEAACARLTEVIAHENEAWVESEVPKQLVFPRLLCALGITPRPEEVQLGLITPEGEPIDVALAGVTRRDAGKMVAAGPSKDSVPVHLRRMNEPYWSDYLDQPGIIYAQYNQCADAPDYPVSRYREQVEKLLDEHGEARLVIDLRNNAGGNSALLDPLIEKLAGMPRFRSKGTLFVIVGRATFSSGLLNAIDLRDKAKAIVVGEPTGGKPNCYGEVRYFELPNSALPVTYSTTFFQTTETDTPSLMPDVAAEPSYADYTAGVDPAMEAILKYPLQP